MQSLYIDLQKGHLNFAKLVKRAVQVKGEGGKTFTRMQWVSAETGKPAFTPHHKPQEPVNIKPHTIPLGLKHTEHGLTEEEVNKRHGYSGTLDLNKLTQGTPLTKAREKDLAAASKLMKQYPFTRDHAHKIDPAEHVANVFKNMTQEGLESVFSDPKGKYTAKLTQLTVWGNGEHGHIECSVGLEWQDKKGNYMGGTERTVWRDSEGHLHVYNELTEIEPKHQGKGIAQNEQERSEQLWKYLSDGHPVHMSLEANISIGVYAWALKGYDFKEEEDIGRARSSLKEFLEKNKMDVKETLSDCGYSSLDDLEHSWQFANLNDNKEYNIKLMGNTKDDIKKNAMGSIGKCFMLGGMGYWKGEKILNGGTEHEEISDMHKKAKKEAKKKKKEVSSNG